MPVPLSDSVVGFELEVELLELLFPHPRSNPAVEIPRRTTIPIIRDHSRIKFLKFHPPLALIAPLSNGSSRNYNVPLIPGRLWWQTVLTAAHKKDRPQKENQDYGIPAYKGLLES